MALCCLQPCLVDIECHQGVQGEQGQLGLQFPRERQWEEQGITHISSNITISAF